MEKTKDIVIQLASSPVYLEEGQHKRCQRRHIRIDLSHSDQPLYVSFPELGSELYTGKTLSTNGASFHMDTMKLAPFFDRPLDIDLYIGDQKFELRARVASVFDKISAIEFLEPSPELQQKIKTLYHLEFKAAELSPFLTYSGLTPGSTHTLVFASAEQDVVEMPMLDNRMDAIFAKLTSLDFKVTWKRSEIHTVEYSSLSGRPLDPNAKQRAVSFLRNLKDLESAHFQTILSIFQKV